MAKKLPPLRLLSRCLAATLLLPHQGGAATQVPGPQTAKEEFLQSSGGWLAAYLADQKAPEGILHTKLQLLGKLDGAVDFLCKQDSTKGESKAQLPFVDALVEAAQQHAPSIHKLLGWMHAEYRYLRKVARVCKIRWLLRIEEKATPQGEALDERQVRALLDGLSLVDLILPDLAADQGAPLYLRLTSPKMKEMVIARVTSAAHKDKQKPVLWQKIFQVVMENDPPYIGLWLHYFFKSYEEQPNIETKEATVPAILTEADITWTDTKHPASLYTGRLLHYILYQWCCQPPEERVWQELLKSVIKHMSQSDLQREMGSKLKSKGEEVPFAELIKTNGQPERVRELWRRIGLPIEEESGGDQEGASADAEDKPAERPNGGDAQKRDEKQNEEKKDGAGDGQSLPPIEHNTSSSLQQVITHPATLILGAVGLCIWLAWRLLAAKGRPHPTRNGGPRKKSRRQS